MRKLDNQILIERYYEEVKADYPNLGFDELKKIVSSPFQFLKDEMASEELPTIRLKYFGTFAVYNKRAEHILKRVEAMYERGTITTKLYEQRKKMINDFLEKRRNEETN